MSEINGCLTIYVLNGKKVLDSPVSNYSYGSLQRVLKRGLTEIRMTPKLSSILLLGLGGGSVIETIREEFNCQAPVTAVDIDNIIIDIAQEEFNINRFKNVNIIYADALDFVMKCTDKFDLIILDVFVGKHVPLAFTDEVFLKHLLQLVNAGGHIVFNTLRSTMSPDTTALITKVFKDNGLHAKLIEKVERKNNLIVGQR